MSTRRGLTDHTLAEVQAGTGIDAQHNDTARVSDVGKAPGSVFYFIAGDTTADDSLYNVEETGEAGRWRRKGSNIVAGSLNVPFTALIDNTEEIVPVAVADAVVGKSYAIGVVSGLPTGVEVELDENVPSAGNLDFIVKNNSGATLTASNIVVNVYLIGE